MVSTAGIHTLNVWMREDGGGVDCIVLTTSSSYTPPSGACPSESPRATSGAGKVLAKPKLSENRRVHERRLTALNTQPSGHIWRTYYMANGRPIAMREYAGNGATNMLYFMHQDHLGSTSLTTSITGTMVSKQWYYPYGEVRWSTSTMPTTIGYTGQRRDANVGSLMFYNARYYSPLLSRFISADSIVPGAGNPQAFNRYSYVLGNPLKYTDPTGHEQILCDEQCENQGGRLAHKTSKWQLLRQEATTPLQIWEDLAKLSKPEQAVAARLLLSEMGDRLVSNINWQEEAIGILWTVQNRVSWMEEKAQGVDGRENTFSGCERGFVSCATSGKQYATDTTTRGRDPLFQDPLEPGKADSYYGSGNTNLAVARAVLAADLFVAGKTSDPTGGAHYFSHAIPECSLMGHTCFARQVDTPAGSYHKPTYIVAFQQAK